MLSMLNPSHSRSARVAIKYCRLLLRYQIVWEKINKQLCYSDTKQKAARVTSIKEKVEFWGKVNNNLWAFVIILIMQAWKNIKKTVIPWKSISKDFISQIWQVTALKGGPICMPYVCEVPYQYIYVYSACYFTKTGPNFLSFWWLQNLALHTNTYMFMLDDQPVLIASTPFLSWLSSMDT